MNAEGSHSKPFPEHHGRFGTSEPYQTVTHRPGLTTVTPPCEPPNTAAVRSHEGGASRRTNGFQEVGRHTSAGQESAGLGRSFCGDTGRERQTGQLVFRQAYCTIILLFVHSLPNKGVIIGFTQYLHSNSFKGRNECPAQSIHPTCRFITEPSL